MAYSDRMRILWRQIAGPVNTNNGRSWYNEMLRGARFLNSFEGTTILIFEADSVFCPGPTRPLASYASYAYVGAPWGAYKDARFPHWCRNLGTCVGNSGFSLWRREVMANVTARPPSEFAHIIERYVHKRRGSATTKAMKADRVVYSRNWTSLPKDFDPLKSFLGHIDVWTSVLLQSLEAAGELVGPLLPPSNVAAQFAVETIYSEKAPWVPVGVHKPLLGRGQLDALFAHCPPARALGALPRQ